MHERVSREVKLVRKEEKRQTERERENEKERKKEKARRVVCYLLCLGLSFISF